MRWKRRNDASEILGADVSGLGGQPDAGSFAECGNCRECFYHALERGVFGLFGDAPDVVDDYVRMKVGGETHGLVRGEDAALEVVGVVVPAARGEGHGGNAEIQVGQQFVEFAESCAREVAGAEFKAGVDLDAGGAEPRGRYESLPQRLPETAGLDSDFDDHEGKSREQGAGSGE